MRRHAHAKLEKYSEMVKQVSATKHNLSGSWLGNYYYESTQQPFGFEAVFIEMNGNVDDGNLGEARVVGTYAEPHVTFTKKYGNASLNIVHYAGTMSDDGKKIAGTWHINPKAKGRWLAWRQDEEDIPEMETDDELDSEQEQEREKVMVRPRTQSQK